MSGRKWEDEPVFIRIRVDDAALEPFGRGRAAWRRSTVTLEPTSEDSPWPIVELEISVSVARASLEQVTFKRRPSAPPLTAKAIRVPLGEVLRTAVAALVLEVTESGTPGVFKVGPAPSTRRGALQEGAVVQVRRQRAGQRRTWDDAEARKALRLYRRARSKESDPFRWVGEQLNRSRSTAYDMVKHAEEAER